MAPPAYVPPPGLYRGELVPNRPTGGSVDTGGSVNPGGQGWAPPVGWPAKPHLDYVKTSLELLLLLLAVPWLIRRIVRNPKAASKAAAKHHLH